MKKLLTALLTLIMILSVASVSALAINWDDDDNDDRDEHVNQEVFNIKEDTSVLSPGVDYYFDCDWQGGPINDDFFEFYSVSVSVNSSDKDELSATTAKKMVEKAEFVKLSSEDKYYFHFRAKGNYSYADDAEIRIVVLAKDNSRDKKCEDAYSKYEMDLEIGYYKFDKKDPEVVVSTSQYDVDSDTPVVEFDEDLKTCRLDFEDGSYYNVRFAKSRRFNLGHTTTANNAIVSAYPSAKLKFISFYANPKFAYESVLKVKAPNTSYLYEIGDNNTLTLISNVNNDGYFGYTTSCLGAYVASNVELDDTKFAVGTQNSTSSSNSEASSAAVVTTTETTTATTTNENSTLTNPATGAIA